MPEQANVLKCDMWSDGWETESTFWVAAEGQTLDEARQALADALADWGLAEEGLAIEALRNEAFEADLPDRNCEECPDSADGCPRNCPHERSVLVYAFALAEKEEATPHA